MSMEVGGCVSVRHCTMATAPLHSQVAEVDLVMTGHVTLIEH